MSNQDKSLIQSSLTLMALSSQVFASLFPGRELDSEALVSPHFPIEPLCSTHIGKNRIHPALPSPKNDYKGAQLIAERFRALRSLVPPSGLPVYRPREHLKGVDRKLMEQAMAELVRAIDSILRPRSFSATTTPTHTCCFSSGTCMGSH